MAAFILCFICSFPDPPRILSLKEPVSRLEHCIEFMVRGNPRPELTWFHNQAALRQVEFIRTEYYGQDNVLDGCLLFNKPTHYYNGYYTLVAKNEYGVANQTVHAHFLEQPYIGKFYLAVLGSLFQVNQYLGVIHSVSCEKAHHPSWTEFNTFWRACQLNTQSSAKTCVLPS